MPVDSDVQAALQSLGPQLKRYREGAQLTVAAVAKAVGVGRQYIYLVEAGTANFTIETLVKYLRACGVPFEEFLRGMRAGDISPAEQRHRQMLNIIHKSDIADLVKGIEVNLEAISEKALRLVKARASPRPESGVGAGSTEGPTREGHHRKKRRAG